MFSVDRFVQIYKNLIFDQNVGYNLLAGNPRHATCSLYVNSFAAPLKYSIISQDDYKIRMFKFLGYVHGGSLNMTCPLQNSTRSLL